MRNWGVINNWLVPDWRGCYLAASSERDFTQCEKRVGTRSSSEADGSATGISEGEKEKEMR